MIFEFINHWVPDPVLHRTVYNLRSAVTWQMASLAVAFPIYMLVMRTIVRETGAHPERLESGVRKWLTYIALLGTAGAMICDLIWFLDYFLTGELTLRFVLKSATVMAIAGAIFAYYIVSLRKVHPRSRTFGAASTATVAVAFLIGMGVAGTPSAQREIEVDGRRVQDLRAIAAAIKERNALPNSLAELSGRARVRDPQTNELYEYRPKSATGYELCANFVSEDRSESYGGTFWNHAKGKACFTLDAKNGAPW
jgi:hypothetical protein